MNQPPRHAAPREALAGSAGELNDRAFRLLRAGRYADAEPLARRALALQPDYPHAQFNLGWSLLAQGRAREAIAPLRRSAAGEPERWEPAQKLGEAYAAIGNRTRAAAAFARSRALRHAPAFASTHRAPDLVPAVARSRRPVRPVDTALTPRNPRARDGARRSPSALRNPRAREARGTNDE